MAAEIYDAAQVNEKQATDMLRQLESHIIPRLASALRICVKKDSAVILVPASKCVESLRRLGLGTSFYKLLSSMNTNKKRIKDMRLQKVNSTDRNSLFCDAWDTDSSGILFFTAQNCSSREYTMRRVCVLIQE